MGAVFVNYAVEKYQVDDSNCVTSYSHATKEEAIDFMEFLKAKSSVKSKYHDYRVVKVTREVVA